MKLVFPCFVVSVAVFIAVFGCNSKTTSKTGKISSLFTPKNKVADVGNVPKKDEVAETIREGRKDTKFSEEQGRPSHVSIIGDSNDDNELSEDSVESVDTKFVENNGGPSGSTDEEDITVKITKEQQQQQQVINQADNQHGGHVSQSNQHENAQLEKKETKQNDDDEWDANPLSFYKEKVHTPASGGEGDLMTLTPEEMRRGLIAHNEHRAKENATAMIQLEWDHGLAISAAERVSECEMSEEWQINRKNNLGENFFTTDIDSVSIEDALEAWMKERNSYTIETHECKPEQTNRCTRYKQVVWDSTTSINCAKAKCPDPNTGIYEFYVIACIYAPSGNTGTKKEPFEKAGEREEPGSKCSEKYKRIGYTEKSKHGLCGNDNNLLCPIYTILAFFQ